MILYLYARVFVRVLYEHKYVWSVCYSALRNTLHTQAWNLKYTAVSHACASRLVVNSFHQWLIFRNQKILTRFLCLCVCNIAFNEQKMVLKSCTCQCHKWKDLYGDMIWFHPCKSNANVNLVLVCMSCYLMFFIPRVNSYKFKEKNSDYFISVRA